IPPSPWRRLIAWREIPAYRIGFQMVATLAIAAFAVWIALIPLRARISDLQNQLTQLRQANEQLQQQQQAAATALAELKDAVSPTDSSLLLSLKDGGGQVTLDKQGNLEGLGELSSAYQEMIKTALTTERLAAPLAVAKLIGKSQHLMGNGVPEPAFTLLN